MIGAVLRKDKVGDSQGHIVFVVSSMDLHISRTNDGIKLGANVGEVEEGELHRLVNVCFHQHAFHAEITGAAFAMLSLQMALETASVAAVLLLLLILLLLFPGFLTRCFRRPRLFPVEP